jgi:hypothetical protein
VLDVLPLHKGLHHEEGEHVEGVDEEVHRGLHRSFQIKKQDRY